MLWVTFSFGEIPAVFHQPVPFDCTLADYQHQKTEAAQSAISLQTGVDGKY